MNEHFLEILLFAGGIAFIITAVSWIAFGRLTMARIERELKQDGFPRPCSWDGPGARILWYAYAISLPIGRLNRADDPMIDVPLVRKYAKTVDVILGRTLLIFGYLFVLFVLVTWFLYGDEMKIIDK